MKYVIVYWSRYGNNKKIVEQLAERLGSKGEVQVLKTDEVDPTAMPEADIYVFSAAAEIFSVQVDMKKLMKTLEGMNGKKYGMINTHQMKKKNQLGKMEKLLSKKKMVKVAEVEFRMGEKCEEGDGLM
ncbi:MAG: flavodoxin family protein, partial [Thermoplasmata archaeon]|nr:flavodoxin family protein [Thermoplasmata archaeon]